LELIALCVTHKFCDNLIILSTVLDFIENFISGNKVGQVFQSLRINAIKTRNLNALTEITRD